MTFTTKISNNQNSLINYIIVSKSIKILFSGSSLYLTTLNIIHRQITYLCFSQLYTALIIVLIKGHCSLLNTAFCHVLLVTLILLSFDLNL